MTKMSMSVEIEKGTTGKKSRGKIATETVMKMTVVMRFDWLPLDRNLMRSIAVTEEVGIGNEERNHRSGCCSTESMNKSIVDAQSTPMRGVVEEVLKKTGGTIEIKTNVRLNKNTMIPMLEAPGVMNLPTESVVVIGTEDETLHQAVKKDDQRTVIDLISIEHAAVAAVATVKNRTDMKLININHLMKMEAVDIKRRKINIGTLKKRAGERRTRVVKRGVLKMMIEIKITTLTPERRIEEEDQLKMSVTMVERGTGVNMTSV